MPSCPNGIRRVNAGCALVRPLRGIPARRPLPGARRTALGAGREVADTPPAVALRYGVAAALQGLRHGRFATDGNTSNTESH